MKAREKTWPWRLLLVVILLGAAAGTWGAVNKIDYKWRWYRVPQYFMYQAEDAQKSPFDGKVSAIDKGQKNSKVTLVSENSKTIVITVATDSLKVSEGEDLFKGDTLVLLQAGTLVH